MQSRSKVFRTQNERKSSCLMNLDVKSCQVKCASSKQVTEGKMVNFADVVVS